MSFEIATSTAEGRARMIFYIESNGYCGTQWLAQILSRIPSVYCYHGTRSLPSGSPLGSDTDMEPDSFAAELTRVSATRCMTIGAIHGKFGPELRQHIKRDNGHYGLAVRHPITRVNSCTAWATAKVKSGARLPLATAADVCTTLLGTDFRFEELAFAFAVIHIFSYDEATLSPTYEFDRIYRMEDYTANSAILAELVAAVTGQSANYGTFVTAAPINCHAGKGRDTPQQIFGGWLDSKRIIFSEMAKHFAIVSSRYNDIGYDLSPFLA